MRTWGRVVCGMTAAAGVLIAVAGMIRLSLPWIVFGAVLYVLGGAMGERIRNGRSRHG